MWPWKTGNAFALKGICNDKPKFGLNNKEMKTTTPGGQKVTIKEYHLTLRNNFSIGVYPCFRA